MDGTTRSPSILSWVYNHRYYSLSHISIMMLTHFCDTFVDRYGAKVGRILIGLLFLILGVGSLIGFSGFKEMTGSVLPMPTLFAILAIVFKIGGGLSLVLGIRVRMGVHALVLFTLLATIFFHLKGAFSGDQMQLIMTLKNIAIIGGLFLVAKNAPASPAPTSQTAPVA
jgi:putative oxidoreductase